MNKKREIAYVIKINDDLYAGFSGPTPNLGQALLLTKEDAENFVSEFNEYKYVKVEIKEVEKL